MKIPFLNLRRLHEEMELQLTSAFRSVLESGYFITRPNLEKFEASFASYCGARFGLGVGNGLDAIKLILTALNIGPGDEVIIRLIPLSLHGLRFLKWALVPARLMPILKHTMFQQGRFFLLSLPALRP